ncbi:MAG: hypothetical protein M0P19_09690 [Nevskia sp.]|jgi:hypothetical protein|nr:hypothetical protein [Nevskia sp.]MCK9384285.1 hypothetical protein [Nevskia sp.]
MRPIYLFIATAALLSAAPSAFAVDPTPEGSDTTSKAAEAEKKPNCLQETGSRIRRSGKGCVPFAGRVYSREELESTGRNQTADALRLLDPSIR